MKSWELSGRYGQGPSNVCGYAPSSTTAGSSSKYLLLHLGIIAIAISSIIAIYLNFEGVRCLTALSRLDNSIEGDEEEEEEDDNGNAIYSQREIEDASAKCFIITNSYVYSLFGVVVGVIMVVVWLFKKSKAQRVDDGNYGAT